MVLKDLISHLAKTQARLNSNPNRIARTESAVHVDHIFRGHVQIILRHHKRGMPEDLLQDYRRSPLADEKGGCAMTDQVRIQIDPSPLPDILDNLVAVARSDRLAAPLAKSKISTNALTPPI